MIFYVLDKYPYSHGQYKNSILLIKDNWDDWFKYETTYVMHYINEENHNTKIGSLKIGQEKMNGNRSADIPEKFNQLPQDCFSLGQSDYYYDTIRSLDDDLREEILQSLNDIAYDLNLFSRVKNIEVTKISLMRDISAFTIQKQFNRIARGAARLTEYDFEYTYPSKNTDNPAKLSFSVVPNSNPPTNIQVIIGRNNVGKTYFVKNLIKSIYLFDKEKYGYLRSTNSLTGRLVSAKTQAFANIICISFSPFDDYSDIDNAISTKRRIPFKYIGLDNNTIHETINDKLKNDFVKALTECVINERKRMLLENAIDILETDPIFEKSQIREIIDVKGLNKSKDEYITKAKNVFKNLSSGHKMILITITKLVETITERTLVILDEPENHLHPPLLSAFIRALSDLLIDRNGVALITTHSPVIVQEVPKSCVWKINRNGYEVAASRLEIESFGATIGSLTREVFGLEVRQSGFHKMLIDEVKKEKDYDEIIETFNNELGDEARILLKTLLTLKENVDETLE